MDEQELIAALQDADVTFDGQDKILTRIYETVKQATNWRLVRFEELDTIWEDDQSNQWTVFYMNSGFHVANTTTYSRTVANTVGTHNASRINRANSSTPTPRP